MLRENVSNMEAKLQESLMKNVLLEEKIHEVNSKHDYLEQHTRKYNLEIDGIPEVHGEDLEDVVIKLARSIRWVHTRPSSALEVHLSSSVLVTYLKCT